MSAIPSPLPMALTPCAGIFPLTEAREAALRARLIAEALTWVGTPYRQLGATKGVAVDCAMLLVRAVIDAGIVAPFDPRPYPPLWFLHRSDERYIDWLGVVACPTETPRAGDIVALQIGRAFAHSGFLIDEAHIVHAFAEDRCCNVSPLRHPALRYIDRAGTRLRPRRFFDIFARLRERR